MSARGGLGLALALVAAATLAMLIGYPSIGLAEVVAGEPPWMARVFFQLQLPRVLLGLAAGFGLGLAGAWMQAILRNPLADPYILGVSGGAAIGSALGGLVPSALGALAFAAVPLGGFCGALGAFLLVLAFGRGPGSPALRMLLAGVVVNALTGAALMVLTTLLEAGAAQRTLVRLMGSASVDPTHPWLGPLSVTGAAALAWALLRPHGRALDLLALGDDTARTLGVEPRALARRALTVVSLLVGVVVAATGLIGFVGLVVPHAVRLWLGPGHARLVPVSATVGAMTVALADAGVSWLAGPLGSELPVGVATAVAGGPLFLWLLARHLRGGAA